MRGLSQIPVVDRLLRIVESIGRWIFDNTKKTEPRFTAWAIVVRGPAGSQLQIKLRTQETLFSEPS